MITVLKAEWLKRQLLEVESGRGFQLVVEVNGKVIGNSHVRRREGYSWHVGELGMAIREGYRDIGIGSEMLRTLISEAEKMALKMVILSVFSTNERAKHVYEKLGFRETGRIPQNIYKGGRYIDEIIMLKELSPLT